MSHELEVVVSNVASLDLDNIRDYLNVHSSAAAEQFVAAFSRCLDTLAATPFVGPRPRPSDPDLRFFVIGKYVVYYRVEKKKVWVQRVLHGAQDASKLV